MNDKELDDLRKHLTERYKQKISERSDRLLGDLPRPFPKPPFQELLDEVHRQQRPVSFRRLARIHEPLNEAALLIKPAPERYNECMTDVYRAIWRSMTSDMLERHATLHSTKPGRRALRNLDVQLARVEAALKNENLGEPDMIHWWPREIAEKRRTVKALLEQGGKPSNRRRERMVTRRKRHAAQMAKDLLSKHGRGPITEKRVNQLAALVYGGDVEVSHAQAVMRKPRVRRSNS